MLPRPYYLRAIYHPFRRALTNTPRRNQSSVFAIIALVVVSIILLLTRRGPDKNLDAPPVDKREPGPPTYEKLWRFEENLPQHNLDLPFPEGKNGRFVKFSVQVRRLGWNNCFNEILMNTHLAYMSNRAYVFPPYHWPPQHYPWPPSQYLDEQPQTPMNALISGPSAGGAWDEGDTAPRAVSDAWFDVVCPHSERRIIKSADVKPVIGWAEGNEIFAHWQKILLEAPERCIEIVPPHWDVDNFPQVFDLWLWGSDRIISLWESFSMSPASRLLETSPIVQSAVARNKNLFLSRGATPPRPRDPYKRMLAMHVRRGDFTKSCESLAKYGSTYYGWNLLPFLPDSFTPLEEGHPDRFKKVLQHCSPTLDGILKKVRDARSEYLHALNLNHTLDVLYILTNEHDEWLDGLIAALRKDHWETIVTSSQLELLDSEQIDVSMAVDMDIARQAAVFIGNGWSSFTSNIVHRRLIEDHPPISCRFY